MKSCLLELIPLLQKQRLSNSPKFTQPESGRAQIKNKVLNHSILPCIYYNFSPQKNLRLHLKILFFLHKDSGFISLSHWVTYSVEMGNEERVMKIITPRQVLMVQNLHTSWHCGIYTYHLVNSSTICFSSGIRFANISTTQRDNL